jgi:hypothetical protein
MPLRTGPGAVERLWLDCGGSIRLLLRLVLARVLRLCAASESAGCPLVKVEDGSADPQEAQEAGKCGEEAQQGQDRRERIQRVE